MATQFNQNLTFAGLGTLSLTVPLAGPYFVEGKITLPTLPKGDATPSALVVTIRQNGSLIYTGAAGAEGFRIDVACAANDVLAMTFASGAAVDQGLNVIKSTIAVGLGV